MMQTATTGTNHLNPNGLRPHAGAAFERRMPGHLDRIARHYERKEKRPAMSARLAKAVLYIGGAMLVLSLVLYFSVSLFGDGISRGGHSASTRKMEVIIANSALHIPSNVIRFESQRHGGNQKRVELYLHWPTVSGYTDELSASFNRGNAQSDLIFLSLEPRMMSLEMSGRINPIYSRFFDGPGQKSVAGLIKQPLSVDGGFIDEDLFYEEVSPYPYATRCVRPGSTINTPFCIRDVHVGKDLMLTYRFHIKHLASWLKIDRTMRHFVEGLIINR